MYKACNKKAACQEGFKIRRRKGCDVPDLQTLAPEAVRANERG